MTFYKNTKLFIHKNASEKQFCPGGRWVNMTVTSHKRYCVSNNWQFFVRHFVQRTGDSWVRRVRIYCTLPRYFAGDADLAATPHREILRDQRCHFDGQIIPLGWPRSGGKVDRYSQCIEYMIHIVCPMIYVHGCVVIRCCHDDVINWKYWPFVRGTTGHWVDSRHKGQWCGALMFSLICAWTNGWANNPDAGDLRRHSAHYGTTVMVLYILAMGSTPMRYDVTM